MKFTRFGSAHSNNVGSMTSLIWPEFDKTGFKAVQDSIVRYGEAVFSPEECKRRIPRTNGPTMSLDGDPYPPLEDPMTLIEDGDAGHKLNDGTMNVGLPVAPRQPQGEFTALLATDWDWGNTLNWGDNASQNPLLWNNAVPALYGPGPSTMPGMPILANGPNVPMAPTMPIMPIGGISIPATPVTIPAPAPIFYQDHGNISIPATPTTIPAPAPIVSQDNGATPTIPAPAPIVSQDNGATPTIPAPAPIVSQDNGATPTTIPALMIPAPVPISPPTQSHDSRGSTTIAASIVTQELGGVSISTPAAPPATLSQSTPATCGDHEGTSIPDSSSTTATPTPVSALTSDPSQPTITQPASTPHSMITPATSTPDLMPIAPEVDSTASATSAAASSAVALSVPTVPIADPSIASSMTPAGPASLGKENETPPERKRKRAKSVDTAKSQERPHRASKPPPHLQEAGYVPPAKGTRKPAAPQAVSKATAALKAKAASKANAAPKAKATSKKRK
ncbi:hypothetical protein PTI98_002060 [Pleurotus ostreatus]|nr:hypothetical protein PTI98_002060 [Pleurotus ostreatus]